LSSLLAFALAAGDLGVMYLLGPPGAPLAPVSLLVQLHSSNSSTVTGFGVWYLLMALPVGIMVSQLGGFLRRS
jgi:ABC-type Fe3+ transport system permease subunit